VGPRACPDSCEDEKTSCRCYTWNTNVKNVPLQAWTGCYNSRNLRLPESLENRHMKMARLSVLRTGHLYPQEMPLVVMSVGGGKDYFNTKSEPTTFPLADQCLSQLRHSVHLTQNIVCFH
jgi:hypothetical protein